MTAPAFLLAAALAAAQLSELSQPTDPRIQLITYNPGQVVTLPVSPGYAAVVELGPDERVDSVVVGDAASWQVTASKRGDHVVVKPLGGAVATNMVIVTGDRRYVFLLQPGNADGQSPFVLRFIYPDAEPVALQAAPAPVATFRFRGDKALFPAAMRDDGRRTTISWGRDTPVPAIFAVEKGREAIVNGRMVDGDYVVERVADRFVFRLGKAKATATRQVAGKRR